MPKACIITLGCRLNQADTALITDRLVKRGYTLVEPNEDGVELVIVNSCAVTSAAGSKSRQALSKWRKRYPQAKIVATGCAVEADFEQWQENSDCDAVFTNSDKRQLDELIEPQTPQFSKDELPNSFFEHAEGQFPFRHRALIKIQEGCNNFCSYCIVPYTRGPERSRAVSEILAECQHLISAGVPELVLTGVNTCAYSDSGYDLGKLVQTICSIKGEFRVRLSSTEPNMNNLHLLEQLAECGDKFCRFLHLSLQHGSDRILKEMGRKYTTNEFATFVAKAREIWPNIHIGTDFIVGFPDETDEDFNQAVEFVKQMKFANMHIFSYSPRPGTPAATFSNQINGKVATIRHKQLQEIADQAAQEFREQNQNITLPVIFETERNGELQGWSDNYLAITAPVGAYDIGKIVEYKG